MGDGKLRIDYELPRTPDSLKRNNTPPHPTPAITSETSKAHSCLVAEGEGKSK